MKNLLRKFALTLPLLALTACGGGGGGTTTNSSSAPLALKYTNPAATAGPCVILLNQALSTGSLIVLDVVGEQPSTSSVGVCLNLQVDQTKLVSAVIPGTRDAEVEHVLATPIASPGGFASGTAVTMRRDLASGLSMMVTAIRRPAPALPASGCMLRLAYQVVGTPVAGVIRAQVMDGSGLLDAKGIVIAGTSPVIGRLEYSN